MKDLCKENGKPLLRSIKGLKKCDEEERCVKPFNYKLLFIQAIATAIDALSVGVIMIDYKLSELIIALLLIMIVTFKKTLNIWTWEYLKMSALELLIHQLSIDKAETNYFYS